MPGKMGDAVLSLQAIRALCERDGRKAHFYTSDYCAPLERLFLQQPFIERFVVSPAYKVQHHGMGTQPWFIAMPDGYFAEYQLGFKRNPDCFIANFIAKENGIDPATLKLELESMITPPHGRVVTCRKTLNTVPGVQSLNPIVVGVPGRDIAEDYAIISGSTSFIGIPSLPLALANLVPGLKCTALTERWVDRLHLRHSDNDYFVNV